jgi:hypothetical protein
MMQGFRALLASELFMRDPTNRQLSQGRGIVDWETQNWGSNPRCETRGDQLSRNHVFQTFADGPSVRRLKDAQRLGLLERWQLPAIATRQWVISPMLRPNISGPRRAGTATSLGVKNPRTRATTPTEQCGWW